MLRLTILAIGKVKQKNLEAIIADYLLRLAPYAKIDLVELPAEKFSETNHAKAMDLEAQRIDKWLAKRSEAQVYLLAEAGKLMDSRSFSEMLYSENKAIVLIIGGSLGFDPKLRKRFPKALSLSPLTMPHELARLVLVEQIYRAVTIEMGKTYHY